MSSPLPLHVVGIAGSPSAGSRSRALLGAAIEAASAAGARTTLLELFFDLLPPRALAGRVAVGVATAASAGHEGVIDHGLRPLFASLEAIVLPAAVFATDADFTAGVPHDPLVARVRETTTLALQFRTSVVPSEE